MRTRWQAVVIASGCANLGAYSSRVLTPQSRSGGAPSSSSVGAPHSQAHVGLRAGGRLAPATSPHSTSVAAAAQRAPAARRPAGRQHRGGGRAPRLAQPGQHLLHELAAAGPVPRARVSARDLLAAHEHGRRALRHRSRLRLPRHRADAHCGSTSPSAPRRRHLTATAAPRAAPAPQAAPAPRLTLAPPSAACSPPRLPR